MITSVMKEDISDILSDKNIPWEVLKDSTILVTGATGLIGEFLTYVLTTYGKSKIFALGRNIEKGKNLIKNCDLINKGVVTFINHDIREPLINVIGKVDYIFHCVAMTKSIDMINKPVEVALTSIEGSRNILEFAKENPVKSMVYLSSMEVYGVIEGEVYENDLGYIDLNNLRSCYPESKRTCEMLCYLYNDEYNIPVKIARLAQTFGSSVDINDTRVFAQFARSVLRNENIILHTNGMSQGNYCYISDVINALIVILLQGVNGETYNISNNKISMRIFEMAELVSKEIAEDEIKVVFDIPQNIKTYGYAPKTGFILNSDKLLKLGWRPSYNMTDIYKRMIRSWNEKIKHKE